MRQFDDAQVRRKVPPLRVASRLHKTSRISLLNSVSWASSRTCAEAFSILQAGRAKDVGHRTCRIAHDFTVPSGTARSRVHVSGHPGWGNAYASSSPPDSRTAGAAVHAAAPSRFSAERASSCRHCTSARVPSNDPGESGRSAFSLHFTSLPARLTQMTGGHLPSRSNRSSTI